MHYFVLDLTGFAAASALAPFLLLPTGIILAWLLQRAGFAVGEGWSRVGWIILLALAAGPAIDALSIRYFGLMAALGLHLAMCLVAVPMLRGIRLSIPWKAAVLVVLWWVVVVNAYADYDFGDRLYQSVTMLDFVKHAAVTEAIFRSGLPLEDPFFLRDAPAAYYYYFYCFPAQLRFIWPAVIDARMAFAAATFWTGIGLPVLLYRIGIWADLVRVGRHGRFALICTLLCFVTGIDLPFMLSHSFGQGALEAQVDWWNETVSFALASLLWVPHHMAAVMAAWIAILMLQAAANSSGLRIAAASLPIAGLAFATMFGSSVWIAITAVAIVGAWAGTELYRRDLRAITFIAIAGGVAIMVALPQLLDLLHGRNDSGFPIELTVRRFAWMSVSQSCWFAIPLLLLLPLNLGVEFGVFAVGTMLFFRKRSRWSNLPQNQRLLMMSAAISLLVASFLQSTIINNDLGWRAIWFAQLAAIVWTAAVVQNMPRLVKPSRIMIAFAVLGIAGTAWDVVGMRLLSPPYFSYMNLWPAKNASIRAAYDWANVNLPHDAVVQQNPALHRRIFDFGLYSTHRTAIADGEANLFGVSRRDAKRRVSDVGAMFRVGLTAPQIRKIAERNGIDAILFTDRDMSWRVLSHLPPGIRCRFADRHVCVALVADMASEESSRSVGSAMMDSPGGGAR